MRNEENRRLREELARKGEHGAFWYSWAWNAIRPFAVGLCVLLIVTGVVMGGYNAVKRAFFDEPDSQDTTPVRFTIASGRSLTGVSNDLEQAGLIRNSTVFKYYADFMGYGQKIRAGEYELSRSMRLTEVLDRLTTGDGKPLVRNVTVIPGWTVRDIAERLAADGVIPDAESFLSLCRDTQRYSSYYFIEDALKNSSASSRPYILEGYLAPDTYEVYTSATPEEIVKKLLLQTGAVFTDDDYARADEIGLTMDEVIILASVIEKEAKNADFAGVSAVFHNRLNTDAALAVHGRIRETGGMLQSDATVKYVTGSTRFNLTDAEMTADTPYNTYTRSGLPAGPICNPSAAAIKAALYPDEEMLRAGVLYFCSTDPRSGTLCFAITYEDHQRNVEVYRPLWEAYDREQELK